MLPWRDAPRQASKEVGMFKSSLRRDIVLVLLVKVAILISAP